MYMEVNLLSLNDYPLLIAGSGHSVTHFTVDSVTHFTLRMVDIAGLHEFCEMGYRV